MNAFLEDEDLQNLLELKGFDAGETHLVHALDILNQMPENTTIERVVGGWHCHFDMTHNYRDFRYDSCPHRAAALAFIAWKKGMKI